VIHAIGPDFRRLHEPPGTGTPPHTRPEAVAKLGSTYRSILREFVRSGQPELRLLPVSGGVFSGPFGGEIAALTWEGLQLGFAQLTADERRAVAEKRVGLCIFLEKELAAFAAAGFPLAGAPGKVSASPASRPVVTRRASSSPSSSSASLVRGRACALCGSTDAERLQACVQCKLVHYCSRKCQLTHWKQKPGGHKLFCLPLEKQQIQENPEGDNEEDREDPGD